MEVAFKYILSTSFKLNTVSLAFPCVGGVSRRKVKRQQNRKQF